MDMATHPSDEQLSAFFDRQLSPPEQNSLQTHINGCPSCREVLDDLAVLHEMGSEIEDRLPSDLYWQDLPDRILARIAAEERAAEVALPAPDPEPWWQRIFSPAAAWRWGVATLAVAVVGGGLYIQSRGDSENSQAAHMDPASPFENANEALPPGVPPLLADNDADEYRQRVARTLDPMDIGTSLDVVPMAGSGPGTGGPIQTVSLDWLPRQMQPALENHQGSDVFDILAAARQCEERGQNALATEGYHIVRTQLEPTDPLHLAAETGLTRCAWRERMMQAGAESTRTLDTLLMEADRMFQAHAIGNHKECRRALELLISYLDLAKDCASPQVLRDVRLMAEDVKRCIR